MSRVKPADVRFYLDADVLGLAHVLAKLRPDVTYPGDPGGVVHKRERQPCPITTRDSRIQIRRREIHAVRQRGARMVALTAVEARSAFDQLEVLMCQWRRVVRVLDEPGPFICAATRTAFRKVPLD